MKKTISLLAILLSLNMFAQKMDDAPKNRKLPKFTAEQNATLKSKQMTLHLDLNQKQQKQVYGLILKQEKSKEQFRKKRRTAFINGERPTKEDQYNRMNKGLDSKIYFQKKLKNILNEKQYSEWKKVASKRAHMRQRHERQNFKGRTHFKMPQRQRF